VLGWDPQTISESERRELVKFPEWSEAATTTAWIGDFQRYFEDHFSFRNRLIGWHSALLWYGLHTSSSKHRDRREGRLDVYADDGSLEDYVQDQPFTAEELETWRLTLEHSRDWLAHRGTKFLFVVAPDKQMIYPERMPPALVRLREEYRADQLIAYLQAHSSVHVLDLRPAVRAAKGGEILYHRHDTHWNDRGALVAEMRIAEELRGWFPAIRPLGRGDFHESSELPSGDRTSMLDLVDHDNANDAGPRADPGLVVANGRAGTPRPVRRGSTHGHRDSRIESAARARFP